MVYLIALYCLVPDPPNPWAKTTPKVEAPACMEHREEYADDLQTCNTRGVMANYRRLARLHDKPFVFSGAYCKEIAR
jgi:hypothetical protein